MTEGLGLPIISVPDIKFVAGKPGTDIRAHLAELAISPTARRVSPDAERDGVDSR